MNKSITKNYIYNLTYQILIIIMPIITIPYLSRTLGPEGIGIYSYTLSIVTYFILFGSLGISMYGQREIAFVQDDVNKRSKVFFELLFLRIFTKSISMLIFYFTYGRIGEYSFYYRILLIEMLANCIDISWFFQGIENFRRTASRNIIIKIISVICIFIFVKNSNDLFKYLLIYVLTTFLGNASLWINIHKFITKVKFRDLKILNQLKSSLILFIPQIAMQIYTVLDKTMIGAITGDMSEVGFYEQAEKVVKILLTIITSLGAVMMPRIAKCFADGETYRIKSYMYKTFRFVYMFAFPLIFGIIAVSDSFVPPFFGEGFDKVKILMKFLSLIILFIGMSNVTGSQYLISTKKQKQFTTSVICGAVVNLILNFILIRYFASFGAVISTVIAEFCVTAVQFYYIRDTFNIIEIIKLAKNYLLSSVIMFIVVIIIGLFITSNIATVFTEAIIGSILYFTLLLLFKDELLRSILVKFKILK